MNQEREGLTRNQERWLMAVTAAAMIPLAVMVCMGTLAAHQTQPSPHVDTRQIERRYADSIKYVQPTTEPRRATIVVGTTGTFTQTGTNCTEAEGPPWAVYASPYKPVAFNPTTETHGFAFHAGGQVSVPDNAPPGTYTGIVLSGRDACAASTDGVIMFSFEVVKRN